MRAGRRWRDLHAFACPNSERLPACAACRIAQSVREKRKAAAKAKKLSQQRGSQSPSKGTDKTCIRCKLPGSECKCKLSEKEQHAWSIATRKDRVRMKIMMLARTIMYNAGKLTGRAAPKERPTEEEIIDFVEKTGGQHKPVQRKAEDGSSGDGGHVLAEASAAEGRRRQLSKLPSEPPSTFEVAPKKSPAPRKSNQIMDSNEGSCCWCGKFYWKAAFSGHSDPAAEYVIAKIGIENGVNIHLLRFFALYNWGLPRPGIVITVTGGASNFDLSSDAQDKILKGMMEGTRDLSPWFVSGGTHSGIMKFVGEARARYNPNVPLIGIAPLGAFKGNSVLQKRACLPAVGTEDPAQSEPGAEADVTGPAHNLCYDEMKKMQKEGKAKAELDPNHSHFIFTTDGQAPSGSKCFGQETKLRADFESCVGANFPAHILKVKENHDDDHQLKEPKKAKPHVIRPYSSGVLARRMENYILESMQKQKIGWHRMSYREPGAKVGFGGIPVISICVQGGPGTIQTVLDATCNGTPALIVRGSGKAADLIADCELMKYSPEHDRGIQPDSWDQNQKRLMAFLTSCGLKTHINDPESSDDKCFDFTDVRAWLSKVVDRENAREYMKELNQEHSPLREMTVWIQDYVERAASMQRNFYGQTPKEKKVFPLQKKFDTSQCNMIGAFCDRHGLVCKIDQTNGGDGNGVELSLLIHLKAEMTASSMSTRDKVNREARPLDDGRLETCWSQELKEKLEQFEELLFEEGEKEKLDQTGKECQNLFKLYDLETTAYCKTLHAVLTAVKTNKCWVYELYSNDPDAPDFQSSLLSCLINGLGHPAADDASVLSRKLSYAITWGRNDVLQQVLEKSALQGPSRMPQMQQALIEAISLNRVKAIEILMDCGACADGFEVELKDPQEEIRDKIALMRDSIVTHENKRIVLDESVPMTHYECWAQLLSQSKQGGGPDYLKMMFQDVKLALADVDGDSFIASMTPDWIQTPLTGFGHRVSEWYAKYYNQFWTKILGEWDNKQETISKLLPTSQETQRQLYRILSTQSSKIATSMKIAEKQGRAVNAQEKRNLQDLKITRRLMVLTALYEEILGPMFVYKIGIQGPYFDLFLWNVLMNRREASELFFHKCPWPIRCGLTACCLLRNMRKRPEVDPITAEVMAANADYFEELTIKIQMRALKDDQNTATQAFNVPLVIWREMSLIDLAMESGCEKFIEECCASTLDDLFTGDISPYGDPWVDAKMCLTLMTLGVPLLYFPSMFRFNPPPRSEVVRSSTQRRTVPEGYPYRPQDHEQLKLMYKEFREKRRLIYQEFEGSADSEMSRQTDGTRKQASSDPDVKYLGGDHSVILESSKASGSDNEFRLDDFHFPDNQRISLAQLDHKARLIKERMDDTQDPAVKKAMRWYDKLESEPRSFAEKMSDEHLSELWEPTFTEMDRLRLFFRSPKVLYLANIIIQIGITAVFKILLGLDAEKDKHWFGFIESMLFLYFISSLVREYLQMMISSTFFDYIRDFWNIVDVGSIFFFLIGLFMHTPSAGTGESGTDDVSEVGSISPPGWRICYAISLFFFIVRILRVLAIVRKLGLLVLICRRMCVDVAYFLVVFLVLVFAFASLLDGVESKTQRREDCNAALRGDGDWPSEDGGWTACQLDTWWFIRTLFQGFGEVYLNEMQNGLMVAFVIFGFVLLNIVLLNLLIAMMSGTYEAVSSQANRQLMVDQYWIIKEHCRWALSVPPIVNLAVIPYELLNFCRRYQAMRKKNPAATFWDLLDAYLSRNSQNIFATSVEEESVLDRQITLRLMAFMERAKASYLKEEFGSADN